jgi:hypothetical protein
MNRPEFAESYPLNRTVTLAVLAMEDAFRFSITKTLDHTFSVSRRTLYKLNTLNTLQLTLPAPPSDESF